MMRSIYPYAEVAGVRIMIRRKANPLFTDYVIHNDMPIT